MPSFPPPRPPAPAPASPPFGLATPAFPFPALARLAGLAPLGESRETVLAALVGARLALATMPPYRLPAEQREARSSAALAWLDAIALPATVRPALAALYAATGTGSHESIARAVDDVLTHAAAALDADAAAELDQLRLALVERTPTESATPAAADGTPAAGRQPPA